MVATLLFLPVFAAGLRRAHCHGWRRRRRDGGLPPAAADDLSGAGLANAGVLTLRRAGAYAVAGHVGALARTLVGAGDAASRPGAPSASGRARAGIRPGAVAWDEPWEAERSQAQRTTTAPDPCWSGSGRLRRASFAGPERTGTVTVR